MKARKDTDADTGAECTQTVMIQHIIPQSTDVSILILEESYFMKARVKVTQPRYIASQGEPGPPFRPNTDDAHLADDDLPEIDM